MSTDCIQCIEVIIGKFIARNGAIQVREICMVCGRNQRGNGHNIPHDEIHNLDALPVLEDYRVYSEPCEVTGCQEVETEWHHWAPRCFFPDDCEHWPGAYLCRRHHGRWHRVVTPLMEVCQ